MNAAVIGGTGHVGAHVVAELAARGDAVRVVSRSAPPAGAPAPWGDGFDARVEHRRADLSSGDGLAEALDGVEVVVNAVGDRSRGARLLAEGTRRLLAAEAAAGVAHHVAISIVGIDRSRLGFHRATAEQECVVTEGPVPWSIVRATQFHTFVDELFRLTARARLLPSGGGRVQPIDPAVVASWLADAAHGGPAGRLPDIAGPEVLTLSELGRIWGAHHGGPYLRIPLPRAGSLGRALHDGVLIEPAAAVAGPTFAQWLAREGAGVRQGAGVRESGVR